MDLREAGIAELIARLKARKAELGIVKFIETPSGEVDPEKVPAVLLQEGIDQIDKYSNRGKSGYPAARILEVVFECVVDSRVTSARTFCKNVRRALFLDKSEDVINVMLTSEVFIRETMMEGPFGYGLPNINGIKLVLNLHYTDEGITI